MVCELYLNKLDVFKEHQVIDGMIPFYMKLINGQKQPMVTAARTEAVFGG